MTNVPFNVSARSEMDVLIRSYLNFHNLLVDQLIKWNPKIHYRVYKIMIVFILNQIK